MPFKIIRNDITKVHADAIVNTANPKPIYANGTDRAIYEAAGSELVLEERAVTYECDAKGTALNYEAIGEAITTVRCNARLDRSWKEKIEDDHRKRGKKPNHLRPARITKPLTPGIQTPGAFLCQNASRFFKIKVFIPLHIC